MNDRKKTGGGKETGKKIRDGRGRKAHDTENAYDSGNEIRELTKAELEVMQILWSKEKAFVNDVIAELPDPKPAYNTISTIVRILEKKGFVAHEPLGRIFSYYPVVSREAYTLKYMDNVLTTFFDNSLSRMVSFFAEKEEISVEELDDILNILKKNR